MKKRDFLSRTALLGILPVATADAAGSVARGPVLLTISGDIATANRGALDPALDQMLSKHGVVFDKAMELDAAALYRLPKITFKPTLEYDAKVHTLSGPLVTTVLELAGVASGGAVSVGLRAVDGYNVALSLADLRNYRMIVATHMDGRPLALAGSAPNGGL